MLYVIFLFKAFPIPVSSKSIMEKNSFAYFSVSDNQLIFLMLPWGMSVQTAKLQEGPEQ